MAAKRAIWQQIEASNPGFKQDTSRKLIVRGSITIEKFIKFFTKVLETKNVDQTLDDIFYHH